MTDSPWDEGPVDALRAERDRAVAAVRQLRAALKDVDIAHQPHAWVLDAQAIIAATAEWEAP